MNMRIVRDSLTRFKLSDLTKSLILLTHEVLRIISRFKGSFTKLEIPFKEYRTKYGFLLLKALVKSSTTFNSLKY